MSKSRKNGPVVSGKIEDGVVVMDTPVVEAATVETEVETLVEGTEESVPLIVAENVVELADTKIQVLNSTSFYEGDIMHKFESKSKMFLALYDRGWKIGQIAKETQSHYSFVYGVIDGKRGVVRQETLSKSDVIRQLVDLGMTPGQIAKELNSNYSYVHAVVKKYKREKERAV